MSNLVTYERFLTYKHKSLRLMRAAECLNCEGEVFLVPFAMNPDTIKCPHCKSGRIVYGESAIENQLPRR